MALSEKESFDLLIIGSGLAGLSTAFYAAQNTKSIAVITRSLKENNSFKAQGGIACALNQGDSIGLHLLDTVRTGDGLTNKKAAKILVEDGVKRIPELIDLGLEFDKIDGKIDFGMEAAHSKNRVLHIDGANTGQAISSFMLDLVEEKKNIHFFPETHLLELISQNKKCFGAIVQEENENKSLIKANSVVLASGGYSSLFACSTNPPGTNGEGIVIAFKAGAKLTDLEFEQFHPTTLAFEKEKNFLISERLRGEGAVIVDETGRRVMRGIIGGELAPRDILSKKLFERSQAGKKTFLDCSEVWGVEHKFPNIFNSLKSVGFDMRLQRIPIESAAHYSIGGIKTDLWGKASLSSLYAVAECSCTGLHGANRLASNSLLEALVYGKRAASKAVKEKKKRLPKTIQSKTTSEKSGKKTTSIDSIRTKLRQILWQNVGIERNKSGLNKALTEIKFLEEVTPKNSSLESLSIQNNLLLGKLIAFAALKRKESRGCHYRTDYPSKNPSLKKHLII